MARNPNRTARPTDEGNGGADFGAQRNRRAPPMLEPGNVVASPVTQGAVAEIAANVRRLDSNMLAVLMLVIVINGMFVWLYDNFSTQRHREFLGALAACPTDPAALRRFIEPAARPGPPPPY